MFKKNAQVLDSSLEPEVLQFVCECDVVKDTGKEEYLRPFIHIGLDWIGILL